VVGHALHAVVSHIPQPLKKEGLLVTNCEIYNWKKLNQKYNFNAKNDADLLLSLLDKFGVDKLNELDGVYAFAYWKKDAIFLARDLLGEKPVWFTHNADNFAFASEKKALEKVNFLDIKELNPRSIIKYEIKENKVRALAPKIKKIMEGILPKEKSKGVPIVANASAGKNWGEMETISTK